MKKVILGSVLAAAAAASFPAHAASSAFCNAPNVATNAAVSASAGGSTSFVKVGFRPKCSANVFLTGNDESALLFRVGAASSKGKSSFNGSSVGGAVARYSDCAAAAAGGACVANDANTARGAAASS
jgi:hypothetical protein